MNWKKEAENDLRNYNRRKESLESMHERAQALKYQREAIKAVSDCAPVQGGNIPQDEKQVNLICEQERLKFNLEAAQILVNNTEKGLTGLDDTERMVLDRFYISPIKNHVESLMVELNYEKSQIYRIKDSALYKFTVALYGITDY